MNEILTVSAKRYVDAVVAEEWKGDIKRIYSPVPVTVKAQRSIDVLIDIAKGDIKRSYTQGGLIVSAHRKIDVIEGMESMSDIKRIWTPGGVKVKGHRLINVTIDHEGKGDFLRICFVTLEHMIEGYPIILTVEQPYGIPWMQNEIVHSAWCWKITRKDGTVLGFTSHDDDIEYNGTLYKASTGFAPSAVSTTGDMAVDNLDAEGMLRSDSLTAEDLRKGLYTNAAIEVFLINYQNLKDEVFLMRRGVLGEVSYGKNGFKAEIRGLMEAFQQQAGKVYKKNCRTCLGSKECGVYLPYWTYAGKVTGISEDGSFVVDVKKDDDFFSYGVITWKTGLNAGSQMEVKKYQSNGKTTLFLPMDFAVGIGDTFSIVAGCDSNATTCRNKFNNLVNFRGEPYIIGNSYSASYPVSSADNIVQEGEDVRVGAYKWE